MLHHLQNCPRLTPGGSGKGAPGFAFLGTTMVEGEDEAHALLDGAGNSAVVPLILITSVVVVVTLVVVVVFITTVVFLMQLGFAVEARASSTSCSTVEVGTCSSSSLDASSVAACRTSGFAL